jgi:von Willebrand factor type A domain/von Willebrand factor type A C-terminal domain
VTTSSLQLSQNKYLSPAESHLHTVLTVRAGGGAQPEQARPAAEVLLVDCSSSMNWPQTKIANARRAAAAAIDLLHESTLFAIVEGTGNARVRYPEARELLPATAGARVAATVVTGSLIASGATAMSTWPALARDLLDRHPGAVRHALLLTDGRNKTEPPERLHRVLDEREGRFTCDAREIGDDWEPDELRRIAAVLRGTADAVVEEAELADDFRRIIQSSMRRTVPDLRLRIVTPPFAAVEFLRQVAPVETELTCRGAPGAFEVSTGSWGEDSHEYHLRLAMDLCERRRFEDRQLGRVGLVPMSADIEVPRTPTSILGHVTEDETLSNRIDEKVERYTVQADLGLRLRTGWVRFGESDRVGTAAEWGQAVRLATELGNEEVLHLLPRLGDIEDDRHGRVRVKDTVRPRDSFSAVLTWWTGLSDPVAGQPPAVAVGNGAPRLCPSCTKLSPPDAKVCLHCLHRFDGEAVS